MKRTVLHTLLSLTLLPCAADAQARRLAVAGPAAPASAVTPPAPPPAVNEARLAWVHGPVEVAQLTPNYSFTGERPAQAGETLGRGARIRVGDGGAAELTLSNGATLRLGERTHLVLFASPNAPPAGQPPITTTTLQRGVLRVSSPAGNAPLIPVATTATTVFLGRGDGVVQADLGGHITRLAVHTGRMRVRAVSREYILRAGSGILEEFGRPRPPYRQLPPQPVWTSAPPERVVSSGEPVDVTAAFALRGTSAAATWNVQLARDPAFRDLVASERLPGTAARWTARALPPGAYYARVVAVDTDRFEGLPSAVAHVVVAAPRVVAGQLPQGAAAGQLARVEVPDGFFCGIDGGRMAATAGAIRLVPGRAHHLRCATTPDGTDVREITVDAARSGPLVHDVRMRSIAWGEGVVAVRLADAEGNEVPYADVRAEADRGVTVEPLREARERGAYTAAVHWPRGVTRARFRFSINGADAFEEEIAQDVSERP
ncbi:MAG: hypothetical protein U0324_27155 [Polyangiales bacterium]